MTQTNQRIDGKRLWDSLMGYAGIGATAKGGVRRLTLTNVDKRARDRFRSECEAMGLTVRVDAIGNMFARRPGRDPSRAPVLRRGRRFCSAATWTASPAAVSSMAR